MDGRTDGNGNQCIVIPMRALIGERMQTPDGQIGRVSGIDVFGIARVVLPGGTTYVHVPQDQLRRPK